VPWEESKQPSRLIIPHSSLGALIRAFIGAAQHVQMIDGLSFGSYTVTTGSR
jgi:hypothetical protein